MVGLKTTLNDLARLLSATLIVDQALQVQLLDAELISVALE